MLFKLLFCLVAFLSRLNNFCQAKSLNFDPQPHKEQIPSHTPVLGANEEQKHAPENIREHLPEPQLEHISEYHPEPLQEYYPEHHSEYYPEPPPKNNVLAMDQHHAMQVIIEKMLIALGPDFLQNNGAFSNDTYPTVASPLNITTEPCPEVYTKCSSEIFFSSCNPPDNTNADLWSQRLNLYFDLPHDLFASDRLLNATLRIYKNSSLPLLPSTKLIVELYAYTKSLTKAHDINFLYDSVIVSNDYIGWISFDTTELIKKLDLFDHHGFLIKVKEAIGVYWNDPTLIVPMNCTDENKTVVPVPFGVITDQPEQKFPSVTIHTGRLYHHHYSRTGSQDLSERLEGMGEMEYPEQGWNEGDDGMEEMSSSNFNSHPPTKKHRHKNQLSHSNKKISGDDPTVRDEIYSYEDGEPSEPKHQYDVIEERSPSDVSDSSNTNMMHRYRTKAFRKPVANQVYSRPISREQLDSPYPSVVSPMESLSRAKSWNSDTWSSTPYINEQHEHKKRLRQKRRHHNHHHQSEKGENHHSHNSHNTHSHHGHKGHGAHAQQANRKSEDILFGFDS